MNDALNKLKLPDPNTPLLSSPLPELSEVEEALQSMILSASGWRKVFAADGWEESFTADVRPADVVLAAQAALTFAETLPVSTGTQRPTVAVGCDTRPTGPLLIDAVTRMLLASKLEAVPLFVTAAPELMAYVKTSPEIDGFIYISASHNPAGHNGLKFGYGDGAVVGGETSKRLIDAFKERIRGEHAAKEVQRLDQLVDQERYAELLRKVSRYKEAALAAYGEFTRRVASGSEDEKQIHQFIERLGSEAQRTPTGIVAELNGSARTLSIDGKIFESLGVLYRSFNDKPGEIVHRIVPEGSSLDPCIRLLDSARKKNSAFTLGYVPDNDGDRGNLVYFDTHSGRAAALPAQQLFALTVLAELGFHSSPTENRQSLAVVVNGPTSMRIEAIARSFGAAVFRTETGEANVVTRAQELRRQGYRVPILGEGSNGGNITHPATVRDPLNTLISILKLLLFRGDNGAPALFRGWCERIGKEKEYTEAFTLTDVLSTLPAFQTTSAYEPEAKMGIRTENHGLLKTRYEEVFLRQWREKATELQARYGIYSWREVNYEGTREAAGFGSEYRSGDERGGLKIIFSDRHGRDTDFLWMRGSGTEPVFRILADSMGADPQRERELLQWHRSMIEEADSGS